MSLNPVIVGRLAQVLQAAQAAPRGGRQTVCGTTGCHQGEVYNAGDPRTKNKNCTLVPSGINRGGAGQSQVVCN